MKSSKEFELFELSKKPANIIMILLDHNLTTL